MSGLPNEEGVEQLRQAAARVRELDTEASRLRRLIQDYTERLQAAVYERDKQASEVLKRLHAMDVASDRNFGWESRVVWFLSELATGAEQYGRTHQ